MSSPGSSIKAVSIRFGQVLAALFAVPWAATAAPIQIEAVFDPAAGPVVSSVVTSVAPVTIASGQEVEINISFANGKFMVVRDVGATDELFGVSLFPGNVDGTSSGSVLFKGLSGDFLGPNPSQAVPIFFTQVPSFVFGDNGIDWTTSEFAFTGLQFVGAFDVIALGPAASFIVDSVSIDAFPPFAELLVVGGAIPEPATWVLLCIGLAALARSCRPRLPAGISGAC